MGRMEVSQEELEKALEKAKKDLEETLAKMTPEERAQAEAKAQKLIAEDQARTDRMIEQAKAIAAGADPIEVLKKPKFCTNCGAPVSGGKFCTNCGSPLQ